MATRQEMTELTDQQVLQRSVDKKYRPALGTFDDLPDGSHITAVAIKTATKLSSAELDQLRADIEAITNVQAARVMVQGPDGGSPTGLDLPSGYQCDLRVEMGFRIRETPEE